MKKAFVLGMVLGWVSLAYGTGSVMVYNASGGFVGSFETIQAGGGWLDGFSVAVRNFRFYSNNTFSNNGTQFFTFMDKKFYLFGRYTQTNQVSKNLRLKRFKSVRKGIRRYRGYGDYSLQIYQKQIPIFRTL